MESYQITPNNGKSDFLKPILDSAYKSKKAPFGIEAESGAQEEIIPLR
jgi:hypothetical protein